MSRKPVAPDWVNVGDNTEFSRSLNLWYKNGVVYDERSAIHNGIIGLGRTLKEIIKNETISKN